MSKILSLDASTKSSGWAIFDDDKLIDYGCIRSSLNNSIERILYQTKELTQILYRNPDIKEIIMEEVIPKNEAYDDSSEHHSNPKVFKPLMWLQGLINIVVYVRFKDIKITFIMPNSWRSKCGIKTGRGVHRDTLKQYDIKFVKDTYGIDVNDDIADAIGIGYAQTHIKKQVYFDWSY